MTYPKIHGWYDTKWLLDDHEIKTCINESINTKGEVSLGDFYYHWDNFELTHQLNWTPTEKQAKALIACVNTTPLPKEYHGPWWPKVKACIEDKTGNPKIWGQTVDRYTCSMIHNIVSKLNEKNFAKVTAMDFPVAWDLCMRFYSDQRAGKV